MPERSISVVVNGEARTAAVEDRRTLAEFLREDCGLTGTHLACEHGVCGACTVLLDGSAVRSCLLFAAQAEGSDVTTIEGLSPEDGSLSPVQQAFTVLGASPLPFDPRAALGGRERRRNRGAFRDVRIAARLLDAAEVVFRPATEHDRTVGQRRLRIREH